MKKVIKVELDDSIIRTPENVVDELFEMKDANSSLFYNGEDYECEAKLDGVLLNTEQNKDLNLRKYYNNVLESEEKFKSKLENLRFRNVKCAALNLRSVVDHYDLSAHEEKDQQLFLKRILVNMQRSYNMLEQQGLDVKKEFPKYLEVLCEVGKVVVYETSKKNFHHDDLVDEAIMYVTQVKDAPYGKEKDALTNICKERDEGSIAKQWLNDVSKRWDIGKNKSI